MLKSFVIMLLVLTSILFAQSVQPPKDDPKKIVDMLIIDPDTMDVDECPEGIDPKACKSK